MTCDPLSTGKSMYLEYPEDLRRSVRVFLGLIYAGVSETNWIAKAIGCKVNKVREIAALVTASDNPVVRRAMRKGLPLSSLEPLVEGYEYTCPSCLFRRKFVPCPDCARPWPAELRPDRDGEDEAPLVRPKRPTTAIPGTQRKLDVMQARVARGESCFHRDDVHRSPCYNDEFSDTVSLLGGERADREE